MPPPTLAPGQAPVPRRPAHRTPLRQRTATLPSVETSSPLTQQRPVEYKIIVLGDSGVGKSSLIRQFVQKTFDERLMATVGCDFSNKLLSIDAPVVSLVDPVRFGRTATDAVVASASPPMGPPAMFEPPILNATSAGPSTRVVRTALQIWDTAGGERHNTLGSIFFRGSDACLLVYDVTNKRSFDNLDAWATEFQRHVPHRVPMIVIGNKADKPPAAHEVSTSDVVAFCERRGFVFLSPEWCSYATMTPVPVVEVDANPTTGAEPMFDSQQQSPQQPTEPSANLERSPSVSTSSKSEGDASSNGGVSSANLMPLDLPLRPAFILASATSYQQSEPVFATLALESVVRMDMLAVRARDGVKLGLISQEEVASSPLGVGQDATLGPARVNLSREGSSRNLKADAAAAEKKDKKKRKCDC